jgi:hypothetical protein
MMRRRLSDDAGQATTLVLMFLLGIVAVAGLVIDGGFLFASRRSLQSMADGAARAGAMAVDEQLLRDSRGVEVVLEPELARAAADDYLNKAGFLGHVEISASSTNVKVNLYRQTKTLMLSIVGIREVSAGAEATATPRSGITSGGE